MGHTLTLLNDVRSQIAAHDYPLEVARARRDAVLDVAKRFPGVLDAYVSGSLAAGLMNHPVTDGDCGIILDRRHYPELGPDGQGVGPLDIVRQVQVLLRRALAGRHPNVTVELMKRGLLISFNEPLSDEDQDPTVDLVIALNRKVDDALWIPCIDWEDEGVTWSPGHPQRHLQLLRAGSADLRRVRAQVIRVGKAWKNQVDPSGICSFNVSALALECIVQTGPLDHAMLTFFDHGARQLAVSETDDPAHVSGPIGIDTPPGRDVVARRFGAAAAGLRAALARDGDKDAVVEALHPVFPDFIKPPSAADSKAGLADSIRRKGTFGLGAGASLATGSAVQRRVVSTSSFGHVSPS